MTVRKTLLRLLTAVTKETLLRSTCEKDRTPLVGGDSASGGVEITCLVQYSSDAGDWHCNYFNLGYTGAQSWLKEESLSLTIQVMSRNWA